MRHIQIHRAKPARSSEYQNLRHVVPSLRRQRDVDKLEVVTEAARYIDQLHKTLIERFVLCGIPDSLKDILGTDNASELGSQHIMNLVASMATTQRQQMEAQRRHRDPAQARPQPSHPAMIAPTTTGGRRLAPAGSKRAQPARPAPQPTLFRRRRHQAALAPGLFARGPKHHPQAAVGRLPSKLPAAPARPEDLPRKKE